MLTRRPYSWRARVILIAGILASSSLFALNPERSLTQYGRFVRTQEQGLPQHAVRVLGQTTDWYLWLGTDDCIARFDGYTFQTFTKNNSSLPSNSIQALSAGRDGVLWIGTLARDIHDTVIQALFGISAHLDALSVNLDGEGENIRKSVDMARKMARHSLAAARESVLDLRWITSHDDDLAAALSRQCRNG